MTRRAPEKRLGGQPGNENARRRRPASWPLFDLKTREGIDALLCRLIEHAWTENVLDPRTIGALNNTTRLLLESRGWIQKTPLQIIGQANTQRDEIIAGFVNGLPANLKGEVMDYAKRKAELESNP